MYYIQICFTCEELINPVMNSWKSALLEWLSDIINRHNYHILIGIPISFLSHTLLVHQSQISQSLDKYTDTGMGELHWLADKWPTSSRLVYSLMAMNFTPPPSHQWAWTLPLVYSWWKPVKLIVWQSWFTHAFLKVTFIPALAFDSVLFLFTIPVLVLY